MSVLFISCNPGKDVTGHPEADLHGIMVGAADRQDIGLYRYQASIKNMVDNMTEKPTPVIHGKANWFGPHFIDKILKNGRPFLTPGIKISGYKQGALVLPDQIKGIVQLFTIDRGGNAEVDHVDGFVGNFEVTIKQRPRYVDVDKCTSCGDCADICPVDIPSSFDANLGYRKAIYIPFAQAVPSSYLLDMDNCLGIDAVRCGKCKDACEAGAINYDDQ